MSSNRRPGFLDAIRWMLLLVPLAGIAGQMYILILFDRKHGEPDPTIGMFIGIFRSFPYVGSIIAATIAIRRREGWLYSLTLGVACYALLDSLATYGALFHPQSSTDVIAVITLPFYGMVIIPLVTIFVYGAVLYGGDLFSKHLLRLPPPPLDSGENQNS